MARSTADSRTRRSVASSIPKIAVICSFPCKVQKPALLAPPTPRLVLKNCAAIIDETIPGCNAKAHVRFLVELVRSTRGTNPMRKKEGRHLRHPGNPPYFRTASSSQLRRSPLSTSLLHAELCSAKWQGPSPFVASGWRNGPGVKAGVADLSGGIVAIRNAEAGLQRYRKRLRSAVTRLHGLPASVNYDLFGFGRGVTLCPSLAAKMGVCTRPRGRYLTENL